MTSEPPPEEVLALAAERQAAREAKDFAAADALRDRIAELGYRVLDGPEGPTLQAAGPAEPSGPPRRRASEVESRLDEPATFDVSLQLLIEGWPDDAVRAIRAIRATAAGRRVQIVVADVTETDPSVYGEEVEVIGLEAGTGWGAARNAGLRRSLGRVVLIADGSVEATGDVLGPIEATLARGDVGVCGPFGISSTDLREFHESSGRGTERRVDAIEGYLMAMRREVLREVGLFDERFRWYRTADIELSFRVRDAGYHAVVVDVPVTRHEHRMWNATSPRERDRLSKRNFYRFLERFRGREDLLVEGSED